MSIRIGSVKMYIAAKGKASRTVFLTTIYRLSECLRLTIDYCQEPELKSYASELGISLEQAQRGKDAALRIGQVHSLFHLFHSNRSAADSQADKYYFRKHPHLTYGIYWKPRRICKAACRRVRRAGSAMTNSATTYCTNTRKVPSSRWL